MMSYLHVYTQLMCRTRMLFDIQKNSFYISWQLVGVSFSCTQSMLYLVNEFTSLSVQLKLLNSITLASNNNTYEKVKRSFEFKLDKRLSCSKQTNIEMSLRVVFLAFQNHHLRAHFYLQAKENQVLIKSVKCVNQQFRSFFSYPKKGT